MRWHLKERRKLTSLIKIYDTTLRDGSQREGISLSVTDKVKIAQKLDEIGIDYIEGGWPGSNPKDIEFFKVIQDMPLRHSTITAFGSTKRPGIKVQNDANIKALIEAGTSVVTLFGKSWDFHVKNALKIDLQENLLMISESVAYLKEQGKTVIFDAEHFFDGYHNNPEYSIDTILAAQKGGADMVVLCDTNGGIMPWELENIFKAVKNSVSLPLGIHVHDDAGLAVANSLVAVKNGARQVQGTINGYGERCGNANLCTIIPNLYYKLNELVVPESSMSNLTSLSRYVAEICNMPSQEQQPYVGGNAFTHKAGIHVNAVNETPQTYEHVSPEQVGNKRRVLVSELSGRSNVLYKAKQNHIDLGDDPQKIERILEKLKLMEHQGYSFEGAEATFELLIWKEMNTYNRLFELEGFRVIVEKQGYHQLDPGDVKCEATIKVSINEQSVHTAAEGNGPVNALDNALRKALEGFYPQLREIKLADYKVRVLDGKDGTGSKVRVLIESKDKHRTWSTVGVSSNIIEASWLALVDSVEYGLLYPNGASMDKRNKFLLEQLESR